jgi:hypothetical protein
MPFASNSLATSVFIINAFSDCNSPWESLFLTPNT